MVTNATIIRAFSAEHASRLTQVSPKQLADWDRDGFFPPEHASEDRGEALSRIYSFQDIVGLRTLAILRKKYKVPYSHLKEVAPELEKHAIRPWSEITLYVLKKRVYFAEPEIGKIRGVKDNQYALFPLESVAEEMRAAVEKLRLRSENSVGHLQRRRNVAHNSWVISGTRILVRSIKEYAAAGYSIAEIIREFPSLTEPDVEAALKHAA